VVNWRDNHQADCTRDPVSFVVNVDSVMKPKVFVFDVDGVLLGTKPGVNSPFPHAAVISTLRERKQKGDHICLCTGRPYFGIIPIIEAAELDDPHIGDGGALVINHLGSQVIDKHILPVPVIRSFLEQAKANGVFVELHTGKESFAEKHDFCPKAEQHARLIDRRPELVESLYHCIDDKEIIKLFIIADDEQQRKDVDRLFRSQGDQITLTWAPNPAAFPFLYGWITSLGVSKGNAVKTIARHLNCPLSEFVGVGDNESDWDFIELCEYGAAVANASAGLKSLLLRKEPQFRIALPDVDENGAIEVFNRF
jgi:hydroxymethylpyrimidine pyrophosphatase-like HAD family hydrolase